MRRGLYTGVGGEGGGQPDNPDAIRDAWSSDDEDS